MASNASEFAKTLAQLEEMGRVEKVDSAQVQAVRTMAKALDENPQNAALWKQYREALKELTADDSSQSVGEALEAMFS